MTRPTDAAIARAFWEEMEEAVEAHYTPTLHEFLFRVKRRAEVLGFDAESPAGTARGSEEAESPFLQGTGCAPLPGAFTVAKQCNHPGCQTPMLAGPCAFAECPRKA